MDNNYIVVGKINKIDSICKIASFDLDHTVIRPKSGKTFPTNKDDWKFYDNVISKLNQLYSIGYKLIIFSNQSGIGKHTSREDIIDKCKEITKSISLPITFYLSISDDIYRKPRIGMWHKMNTYQYTSIDMENSFYCGDTAGRNKDFSASDCKFALNLKLTFYTPEELFSGQEYSGEYDLGFDPYTYFKDTIMNTLDKVPNQNKEVIIFVGSPASGKTTMCMTKFSDYIRINQDELKTISKCKKLLKDSLQNYTHNIIIDSTNRNAKARKVWIDLIRQYDENISIVCINIDIPKYITMHNNCFRMLCQQLKNNEYHKVPAIAIHTYYKNYEEPTLDEGFNDIISTSFILDRSIKNIELLESYLL